jgi:EAL domain-containing protein (putative c-di-GMP-specific phosphodiesterase class I)
MGSASIRVPPALAGKCGHCATREPLDFQFTFAFQPSVDVALREIFAYEALVRGPKGEAAFWVLDQVTDESRYRFDQDCRVAAIALAARLGLSVKLSINFMPNAVYRPETCIRTTFAAADKYGFPVNRIIFEVVENDHLAEPSRLVEIMSEYKRFGFLTALDDFGAGFAELKLLARFQPHVLKLDMDLIRGIETDPARQAIARGIIVTCVALGVRVLAEGVETAAEFDWLRNAGIELFQGYLFARPGFQTLPQVDFKALLDSNVAPQAEMILAKPAG